MSEQFIAHVKQSQSGEWRIHALDEHLYGVARLAAEFAAPLNNQDWAYVAGLWHDLGKYSLEFQSYIKSASGYEATAHLENQKGKVDHSTAGAIHAMKQFRRGKVLAYLIAGHHAGLADWENAEAGRSQLSHRVQQAELLDRVVSMSPPNAILDQPEPKSAPPNGASPALWIRFLFSCLVDADFLDTESFMDQERTAQRSLYPSLKELVTPFNAYLQNLCANAPSTTVNRIRAEILEWCQNAGSGPPGIYSLTVPTGGGKTLSSVAFALRHAIEHNKRRLVYVIPYTSIVEQTANVLRNIFGSHCVLEHHSNFDPELETIQSRLACENWDAPVVVTTNVQFFESLFAARTSRVRKLHRLVDSVVILDEAQLIPPEFLTPIMQALNELATAFKVTVLLSTATQPTLKHDDRNNFFKGLKSVTEIVPDPSDLYRQLKRITVILPDDLNRPIQPLDLSRLLSEHEQVLCIVNRRDECRELHALMPPGAIHLSGYMCGEHKSAVIARIKLSLKTNEIVRVISTQLVEAGVDFDFPVVFRALTGIDSIAQAGGRCNREGLAENGNVHVFVSWKPTPRGHLSHMEAACREVLRLNPVEVLCPNTFDTYFRHLYWMKGKDLDKYNIVADLSPDPQLGLRFREAATKFKIIDDKNQRSVFVRYGAGTELIEILRRAGPDRWLLRKLQRFSVSIPLYIFNELVAAGDVIEVQEGFFAQAYDGLYHPETGFLGSQTGLIDPDSLII
jgi:CRISPR-associated endonuclease/helicase Cas3